MNCHYAQNLISAFIDRELDADEKRELRKHLVECSECNLEYQYFLRLKNCLENIRQEPCSFDPILSFRARLATETVILPRSSSLLWAGRMGLVAAGLLLFFLSTAALFPSDPKSQFYTARRDSLATPASFDQNITIDQPVTIYQASSVLP
jgi:anti-sigma factor RsiW